MSATDLSDVIKLLQFTGHYCDFPGHRWSNVLVKLQAVRVVYMVACNPFTISSVFMGGIKSSMGVEFFFGLMGFLTAIQHVHFYSCRKQTADIIQSIINIREKFQKGTDEEFKNDTAVIWKVLRIYFAAMTLLIVGYLIFPKLLDLLIGMIWQTPTAYRVAMSMDAYLEKEQPRNMNYFIVSFVSITWSTVSTYAHFGGDALLCLTGFYYSSLVNSFCRTLNLEMGPKSERSTANVKTIAAHHHELYIITFYSSLSGISYKNVYILLTSVIAIGQLLTVRTELVPIHRLSLKLRLLFGYAYGVQNLFASLCICSLLYAILSDHSGGPLVLIANLFNFMILTGMLTSTAYVGQQLTNQSTTIFEALYAVPWYELHPSDRKYFIMMICATREPFRIHYHGSLSLDYKNFMTILNTSYSYLMFMNSTI